MAAPGVSTLGIRLGWANGVADTLPTSGFTWLTRINAIDGISLDTESIDASALEDYVTKTIAGRADTGGTWTVTVNETDETEVEWEAVFAASAAGEGVWMQVWSPNRAKANFIFVQTPPQFPLSAKGQNELETVEIVMTIVNYHGLDSAVEPPTNTNPNP